MANPNILSIVANLKDSGQLLYDGNKHLYVPNASSFSGIKSTLIRPASMRDLLTLQGIDRRQKAFDSAIEILQCECRHYGRKAEIAGIGYSDLHDNLVCLANGRGGYYDNASDLSSIRNNGDGGIWLTADQLSSTDLYTSTPTTCVTEALRGFNYGTGAYSAEETLFLLKSYLLILLFFSKCAMMPLLVITGPKSSGKTTLLKILNTIIYGDKHPFVTMLGTKSTDFQSHLRYPFASFDSHLQVMPPWLIRNLVAAVTGDQLMNDSTRNDGVPFPDQLAVAIAADSIKKDMQPLLPYSLCIDLERLDCRPLHAILAKALNDRAGVMKGLFMDAATVVSYLKKNIPIESIKAGPLTDFYDITVKIGLALGQVLIGMQ